MPRFVRCIYCHHVARSDEHIVATRFIEVLREDPRGLPIPIRLTMTLPDTGQSYRIGGRRTKNKHYTLEYTTRVCSRCNSEWMNDIDDLAFPHVSEMIRGNPVHFDSAMATAVAGWVCKVVVTARSHPLHPMPIEREWMDWLYQHHAPLPRWYVWVGRYIGREPFWYQPHDISIRELEPGSALVPHSGDLIRDHGALATMVIGYMIVQAYGVAGEERLLTPDHAQGVLQRIWPFNGDVAWPSAGTVDDSGLQAYADRLLSDRTTLRDA